MRITAMIKLSLATALLAAAVPAHVPSQDHDCRGTNDVFEVKTNVGPPTTVFPGGFGNGALAIENHHASLAADVHYKVSIEFSDGSIQELTGLGSPVTLGPGQGLVQFVSFIVPQNAPPGPAVFTCSACAAYQGLPPVNAFAFDTSPFTVQ